MSDNYPNIAIKTEASIEHSSVGRGYRWVMSVHVEGPDDYLSQQGDWFRDKRSAAEDMLRSYDRVMGKLHKELLK